MPVTDFADLGIVALLFVCAFVAFHVVKIFLDHRDYRRSRKAYLEQERLIKSLYNFDRSEPPPPIKIMRKRRDDETATGKTN